MKKTVDSWVQQGNELFLAGAKTTAMRCYIKALKKAGALPSVVKYVQQSTDFHFEDQELLQDLLQTRYHIGLVHDAVPALLINIKKQVSAIEDEKAYPGFKDLILSKRPTTPGQFVNAFLDEFEEEDWRKMLLLSRLLQEQGFNYDVCDVSQLCYDQRRTRELKRFERSFQEPKSTILSDIETMTGYEFEDFLVTLFTQLGYRVEQKKRSHEQGLDLLLIRHGEKIACQAKRQKSPVGNKAVQQVIAAREHYRCQRGLVVTNTRFTTPAKQLAERCKIELWDGKKLKEKIAILM